MRFAITLMAILAVVSATQSATINVPADQPTIQTAINAASSGDTIAVAPGVYAGPITIPCAKLGITLSGAGKEATFIDVASGGTDAPALSIGTGNCGAQTGATLVEGFCFRNTGTAARGIGIRGSATAGQHGLIRNNRFEGFNDSGISFPDYQFQYWDIDNNEFDGARLAIWVNDARHISITNNQFSNFVVAVGSDFCDGTFDVTISGNTMNCGTYVPTPNNYYGVYFGGKAHDWTITDNVLSNFTWGIYVGNCGSGNELSNVVITNNSIAGPTQLGLQASTGYGINNLAPVVLNAPSNWWGAASGPYQGTLNPGGTGTAVTDNVDFTPWLSSWPPPIMVDDDGMASAGSCDASDTAHSTIGAAVAAASPGDTIKVCPGAYPSVTVNKSVTLLGANAGVHPAVGTHPTETVGVRGPESVVAGLSPAADGITVDGFKFLKAGTRLIDTYVDANDFHLTNCIVESTVNGPTTGVVQIAGGSHTDMVLDFNLFLDKGDTTFYTGGGPFDRLRIAYNRFNVEGDSIFWTASPLVDGVIEGNEFDGTIGGVPGVGFAEINIGQGGNIAIRDNWFHDQQYIAFQVGIIGGSVTGNTIERMYPYSTYGADAFQLWGGQWGTAVSTNVDISCNLIRYNDIPGAASPTHGIRLRAPETGSGIDGSTIHISNNIFADGGARADAKAIRHQGDASTTVDAENNWWGTTDAVAIAGLMSGNVDYDPWLSAPPACSGVNLLYLEPTMASIYIKPNETAVIDLNVANLAQPVTALQAMLNFSSTYFQAGPGQVNVAPGGGTWNDLIYDVWNAGGDLDVAVGIHYDNISTGTTDDAKTTIITLTPTGTEGITRMVFRPDLDPDPGLTESTFLSDISAQPVWPTKLDSANIIIDGTAPTISVTSAVQGATDVLDGANTVVQGTVTIQVEASDALAGLAAAPTLELTNGAATVNLTTTDTAAPFSYTWTVDASTPNGQWDISASVSDRAGNTASDTDNYLVLNKNQITGQLELESFVGASRDVTFAATGGTTKTWTLTLSFSGGVASYVLTDVPAGTTGLSAKTAWSLRNKLPCGPDGNGQAVINFTGAEKLLGGDLNGTNSINVLDYSILKSKWFSHDPVADIDGANGVGLLDYGIMQSNWFKVGDEQ